VHDALTSTPIFVIRPPRCQGAVGWVSVGGELSVSPMRRGANLVVFQMWRDAAREAHQTLFEQREDF
jgi:hypothetical protein